MDVCSKPDHRTALVKALRWAKAATSKTYFFDDTDASIRELQGEEVRRKDDCNLVAYVLMKERVVLIDLKVSRKHQGLVDIVNSTPRWTVVIVTQEQRASA